MTTTLPEQTTGSKGRLEPMASYVVAVDHQGDTSGTGLVLPETMKKPSIATVQDVGPDVHILQVGDVVVYKEGAAVELMISGQRYLLVREADVLARLRT